jgi:hypothetical protein
VPFFGSLSSLSGLAPATWGRPQGAALFFWGAPE